VATRGCGVDVGRPLRNGAGRREPPRDEWRKTSGRGRRDEDASAREARERLEARGRARRREDREPGTRSSRGNAWRLTPMAPGGGHQGPLGGGVGVRRTPRTPLPSCGC
jgi:hypothetical protein